MKKLLPALCLTLLLTACGGQAPADTPAPVSLTAEEAAQVILSAEAFSEQLEVVDDDIAAALYGLEGTVSDCAGYLSTGATAEECTFLIVESEEAALAAAQRFQLRVEDQLLAVENYQPAEVPKLEEAIHGYCAHKNGYLAYLVVANDPAAAQDAVDSLVQG